jgi:His-Xaa-Ser system radical SAM maturase HxsC
VEAYLQAIPLMDPATEQLGITGGEPTLLGDQLLALIAECKKHLPSTSLVLLSNGRMFNYLSLCQDLVNLGHPKLVVAIPLYSDIPGLHDFVVQARGAFDETVRGIMNLARCRVPVELRVVLHRQTIDRLPELAMFIGRNFPFVKHVALMGLELTGFAKTHRKALWLDPFEYQPMLAGAVHELVCRRMSVSIYNHQLCILDRSLWPFARQSISDWKNSFLSACAGCAVYHDCCGFFDSDGMQHSASIQPLRHVAG